MRYQMIYAECKATRKEAWGKVIGSGKSILELFQSFGFHGDCGLSWDQTVEILDTKTGKKLSEKEYYDLVNRLKGWTK